MIFGLPALKGYALVAIDFVVFGGVADWAACLFQGRRPGVARHASPFLSRRRKKGTKERATPLSASPALRSGATCGARVWRGLAQLAPLRVAQTHASPDPPNPALLGASRGARRTKHPHGPLLRSAPPRGRKRHALPKLGRAQRWPEWMLAVRLFGCSAAPPLLAAPAAGRLWGGMGVEAPMLRELTRRSCLNEARQREVSSAAHPATDTPQVCPFAPRRGRRLGVAFSLVTFFWRSKRKLLARRATPGLRPQQRHPPNQSTQHQTLQNQ